MDHACLTIWNRTAAKAIAAADVLEELKQSIPCDVVHPDSTQETRDALNHYLERGLQKLIVAGGDGTINSVVNSLALHSQRPVLGLLPLGTANDLCGSLNIPDDPHLALQLIDQGQPQGLDVIEVQSDAGRQFFVNMATGGNSARVTAELTDDLKQRWGPLCYLRGAISVLTDLDVFEATIRFDDQPAESLSIWNILVANAPTCGGRVAVAPRASANDGLLDIILVRDGTVSDMAHLAAGLLTGDYLDHEQVVYRQARRFEIQSRPPLQFTLDGELMDSVAQTFVVHRELLPVIVPRAASAAPPHPEWITQESLAE